MAEALARAAEITLKAELERSVQRHQRELAARFKAARFHLCTNWGLFWPETPSPMTLAVRWRAPAAKQFWRR